MRVSVKPPGVNVVWGLTLCRGVSDVFRVDI